jgi:hypothetical protein
MKKLPANKLLPFVSATTLAALLAACGTTPKAPVSEAPRATNQPPVTVPVLPKANSGKGGYYKDDGPGENPPPGLEFTVDPIPKIEPYARGASKPYVVFEKPSPRSAMTPRRLFSAVWQAGTARNSTDSAPHPVSLTTCTKSRQRILHCRFLPMRG